MGLFKKKSKSVSQIEAQLERVEELLSKTDPASEEYDKLLDLAIELDKLVSNEHSRKGKQPISKETWAKIGAMLLIFAGSAYGNSQGWILGKDPTWTMPPKPNLWNKEERGNKK